MAYQALYRKYRPQNFDEVVGQDQIVQTLKNAVTRQRVAHAYLFCGPRGTGKTSIAKIFAKTLNCTGSLPPCNQCENCKLAAEGTHPDIIEIDAASNNGVEEVRNLIELVHYAPIQGKYKVYIIDEVHMMTTGAFNALLKTIEEPPAHAVFIFATTEPNKVLPTILSRCQRYDFNRVADSDIQKRLEFVCHQEEIQFESSGLQLITTLAEGGMRDALSILDQCIAYSPDQITSQTVREVYGLAADDEIGEIFIHLNPAGAEEAVQKLNDLSKQGMDLQRFLASFIRLLKDSLLMDFSPQTELVSPDERKIIDQYFLSSVSDKRIRLLEDLIETSQKIRFAGNVLDYIETVLLKNSYTTFHEAVSARAESSAALPVSEKQKSDFNLPNSDISKKPGKVKHNSTISDLFWKSDVSRETFQECETSKSTVMLEDEFILSLLAGSDKQYRMQDTENMKNLQIYESELSIAKFAISLRNAKLEASSKTYLLVSVPTEREANQINEFQSMEGFELLTSKILEQSKAVYAIPRSRVKGILKQFTQRWKEKTLPPAYTAPLRSIDQNVGQDLDTVTTIQEFFPDVKIVED